MKPEGTVRELLLCPVFSGFAQSRAMLSGRPGALSLAVERRRVSGTTTVHENIRKRRAPFTRSKQRTKVVLPNPIPKVSPHNSPCPRVKGGKVTSGQREAEDAVGFRLCLGQFSEQHLPSITQQKEPSKAARPRYNYHVL